MYRKRAAADIVIGLLLMAAAVLLAAHNLWEAGRAQSASRHILEQLGGSAEVRASSAGAPDGLREDGGLFLSEEPEELSCPAYVLNPQMEMPTREIDGLSYVAVLDIPELSLSLPILSDYVFENLRKSPCRYFGSAYTDDLVICAHNYSSHFGTLGNLSEGDTLTLTDMDDNVFSYVVREICVVNPYEMEELVGSGYALTLFTCTVGGNSRVTVHCDREEEEARRNSLGVCPQKLRKAFEK